MSLLLGFALVVLPALGGVDAPASRIAPLELRDQYGNTDSLARRSGAPVVAVIVSIRRLPMIERWERDLAARVPGIGFLNVADLPADETVDLERTAATLRRRVPPGVNVLLDPDRAWATAFALDTDLPNLLVFDAAGRLTARFRGRWSVALADAVVAAWPGEPAT